MWTFPLICLLQLVSFASSNSVYYGLSADEIRVLQEVTIPTRGYVWPAPKSVFTTENYYSVDLRRFKFEVIGNKCSILKRAIQRYTKMIKNMTKLMSKAPNLEQSNKFSQIKLNKKSSLKRRNLGDKSSPHKMNVVLNSPSRKIKTNKRSQKKGASDNELPKNLKADNNSQPKKNNVNNNSPLVQENTNVNPLPKNTAEIDVNITPNNLNREETTQLNKGEIDENAPSNKENVDDNAPLNKDNVDENAPSNNEEVDENPPSKGEEEGNSPPNKEEVDETPSENNSKDGVDENSPINKEEPEDTSSLSKGEADENPPINLDSENSSDKNPSKSNMESEESQHINTEPEESISTNNDDGEDNPIPNVMEEDENSPHNLYAEENPIQNVIDVDDKSQEQGDIDYDGDERRSKRSHEEPNNEIFKIMKVDLKSKCELMPSHNMDEAYELRISNTSLLTSNSVWGILRGLESFSQLMYYNEDFTEVRINSTRIKDSPRYGYRGLMLDTSAHFISKTNIFRTLDVMAYNKFNVFHWHIVDDNSFPYVSMRYPNISHLGAYHRWKAVYTPRDVMSVIDYARDRGIRVIPEFDIPGHVTSLGKAFPNFLTQCYNKNGQKTEEMGPLNPFNAAVYSVLYDLFQELQDMFVDNHIHLGGDTVDYECWLHNPDIKQYLAENKINCKSLHNLFFLTMMPMLPQRYTPIVWQDVLEVNVTASDKFIVQLWKYTATDALHELLTNGYHIIYSSCWNIDRANNKNRWTHFHSCDPRAYTHMLKKNIIGGTVCVFDKLIDNTNVISSVWPLASGAAEALWTKRHAKHSAVMSMAERRMEEHVCRMRRRGVEAEPPNGPSYCAVSRL